MPEFEPRRADPGQRFHFTARDGEQRTIKADAKGVVRPSSAEEVEILDGFDLPVAGKALAADKKAEDKGAETTADKPAEGDAPSETTDAGESGDGGSE